MSQEMLLSVRDTPDSGDMLAVARASRRYHYSLRQRQIALLPKAGRPA